MKYKRFWQYFIVTLIVPFVLIGFLVAMIKRGYEVGKDGWDELGTKL